eukprot:symbB.v1.2.023401.t1/scaffold2137.1/size89176/4
MRRMGHRTPQTMSQFFACLGRQKQMRVDSLLLSERFNEHRLLHVRTMEPAATVQKQPYRAFELQLCSAGIFR